MEMTTYGPADGECKVSVYRQGALSAVGHDLRLRVTSWSAEVDLDQTAFGIEPVRALLGAPRVKPEVDVALSVRRRAD